MPGKIAIGAALLFILRWISPALAERIEHQQARKRSRPFWRSLTGRGKRRSGPRATHFDP
jgi:hypothetical protein